MLSIHTQAKGCGSSLKPVASEADLRSPVSTKRPQTIILSSQKGSFRLHRPSHYFRRSRESSDMDLSRPKIPVTFTYSHQGTQPPVYIACSLTNPPWAPLEMDIKEERTPNGDLIFEKKLDAVEAGEYQYKFRLGPGDWWVLDENAPTISDEAGNSNNLLTVKHEPQSPVQALKEPKSTVRRATSVPDLTAADAETVNAGLDTEDSMSKETSALPAVPFTVIHTVPDQEQPVYDTQAQSLDEDPARRKADAEPDAEYESTESSPSIVEDEAKSPLPTLTVIKSDDEPSHGDDFGPEATHSQRFAHEQRAADAEPDQTIISPDTEQPQSSASLHPDSAATLADHEGPYGEASADEDAPLLPHESFDVTPQQVEEDKDEDKDDTSVPLFHHESSVGSDTGAVEEPEFEPVTFEGGAPLFRHETSPWSRPEESPPRSPTGWSSRSHTSLKDMMDDEDINDPSLVPFPTKRETIYEHIQNLENRLEEDKSIPEDASSPSSSRRESLSPAISRSSSAVNLSGSPLKSIQEDEGEEDAEESLSELPSSAVPIEEVGEAFTAERPVPAERTPSALASVPTPPLTPEEDKNGKRVTRTDSVVTVHGEESSKDNSSQDVPKTLQPRDEQPASSVENADRSLTATKTADSPERKRAGFLISLWNTLFGSWLGPIGRWLSKICGGRGRATALVFAIAATAVAYAYQDILLPTNEHIVDT